MVCILRMLSLFQLFSFIIFSRSHFIPRESAVRGVPSPYGFAEYALSFPGRRGGGSLLIESAAVHLKKSNGSQAAVVEAPSVSV